MTVLNQHTLADGRFAAAATVTLPTYDRAALVPGVVHLGLGAFHRAHQALVFDRLLQNGDTRWGVLGVAMRSTELADSLAAQDGLYAVQIADREGARWQVSGSLLRTCVAGREPQRVVDALAAPATRWVTLTVTEKGYDKPLAKLLVDGLAARRAAAQGGLTIASCDNLSHNGLKLQRLCLDEAADRSDPYLAAWIETHCAFPNSMVDRIVPAATEQQRSDAATALGVRDEGALATEAFWEWVIERRFADPADADVLAAVGVTVVDDVKHFEDAKLRMLNGSHTALALVGAVQGWLTVSDGVAIPAVRDFVHGYMTRMVMPRLKRPGGAAYRDALLARFANPALRHRVHQIASDSSLKIPLRWGPTLRESLAAGQGVEPLAFATAVWFRYLQGTDEQGQTYEIADPRGVALQEIAKRHPNDAVGTVQALLAVTEVWDTDLANDARWTSRVAHWLERIRATNVGTALAELAALEEQN